MTPLDTIIRFTASVPDLSLRLPSPSTTTIITLKHLIRAELPRTSCKDRLRLIYGGKILLDTDTVSSALKLPPPPPLDTKGKGKADNPPTQRVYINCSLGDTLTEAELLAEATAATSSVQEPSASGQSEPASSSSAHASPDSNVTAAPVGFDRLLATGFTSAEVSALRLQFLAIQAHAHTPDSMPSPAMLRQMEDAWIDNNNDPITGGGAVAGAGGFIDNDAGNALEDLLWGNVMGFLWPLGAVGWLLREEGVWSQRRQMAVFTGFVCNIIFGILRVIS